MVDVHGFCDERFIELRELFQSNLDSGVDEGASFAVTLHGEFVVDLWGGYRDWRHTSPWTEDTLVCVFSTSKVMVIICILMLYDRGLLDIHEPIARYWPEFAQNGKETVTTWQVLVHRSGLPGFGTQVSAREFNDWEHMIGLVERAELWYEPGAVSCYHPHTFGFILGELVQRISGRPFAQFFTDEVADPLRADFHYGLTAPDDLARVSQLWYPDGPPRDLNPVVERVLGELEPSDWVVPDRIAAVLPSAGGLTNARGLARIGAMLAMGGELDGRRYLSRGAVEEATREQSYMEDLAIGWCRYGLGFGLHSEQFEAATPTSFHWGGYGGSFITMDIASGLSSGFAMNRMLLEEDVVISERLRAYWRTIGRISAGLG